MPEQAAADLAESRRLEDVERRRRLAWFVVVALLLVVGSNGLNIWLIGDVRTEVDVMRGTQSEIQQTQADGIIRGLKLRAIGCRTVERLGGTFPPGDPCLEPAIRPFFVPQSAGP